MVMIKRWASVTGAPAAIGCVLPSDATPGSVSLVEPAGPA